MSSNHDAYAHLRHEFQQHWRDGARPSVESFVLPYPNLPDETLLDLIYQEYVIRDQAGEKLDFEEYRGRFPQFEMGLKRQLALYRAMKEQAALESSPSQATTIRHETAAAPAHAFGDAVEQYELEGVLGRGGMGIVFKARDGRLRRTVAVKMLLNTQHVPADLLQRFRAEAAILAQLQHPNIVQIFEVGENKGVPFFAMEFVDGADLQQLIRANPLAPKEAALLVQRLAQAMESAHQRGIVHRDLKPSNVLVAAEQQPKITDFGLARQGNSELTAAGAILGTPSYMAPEQALGQLDRIGPTTDIYALGAILYELLTGRAPFLGPSVPATLHLVVHSDAPSPRRLQPTIPLDLETICLKCLSKAQEKRYASAQELADDLQRFLQGVPIQARPVGRIESLVKWARREPKVAALALAVVMVTVVGFLVILTRWQSERRYSQQLEQQVYFSSIRDAARDLDAHRIPWAKAALEKCLPNLREWEWHHLSERCEHGEAKKIETPGAVACLASHPDAETAVVGCGNGQLLVLQDAEPASTPMLGHLGSVNCVVFTPDGQEFYSGGEDTRVQGWKNASLGKTKTFTEHQGPISCMAMHPQEPWIASTVFSGPDVGSIALWNRLTNERIRTLKNHSAAITGLAFHPQGTLLASASHDKTITLWDCRTGEIVRVLDKHRMPIACVAFSPDGRMIASAAGRIESDRPEEDEILLWETATGVPRHRLHGHDKRAVAVAFAPGGRRLATAGWDHHIKIWDVATGQDILTLSGHEKAIMTLAFSAKGSLLSGSLDRSVRRFDR